MDTDKTGNSDFSKWSHIETAIIQKNLQAISAKDNNILNDEIPSDAKSSIAIDKKSLAFTYHNWFQSSTFHQIFR